MATVLELKKEIQEAKEASHRREQQFQLEKSDINEKLAVKLAEVANLKSDMTAASSDLQAARQQEQAALSQAGILQVSLSSQLSSL